MQIVIEFPDIKYQWIKDNPLTYNSEYCEAIRNGTPLPKGHGRLIDFDEINFDRSDFETYNDYSFTFDLLDDAPIIIEADSEVEE